MIKEVVASIKADDLDIMFRMAIGYFDEESIVHLSIQSGIWKMFNLKQLTVDLEDAHGKDLQNPV